MAVVDVTLDNVIRRTLAMKGVSLHYYVPMLIIAKRGLEEMHFDSLQKLAYTKLTLPTSGDKIVSLPVDYVEYVRVGVEDGDKVRPIGFNPDINQKDNSGAAFPVQPLQYSMDESYITPSLWMAQWYNQYGSSNGRQFGANNVWEDSFTVNRELGVIRVDNNSAITHVHLIYLTLPKKVTNQSVIHPFAQQALIDYMLWKWASYTGDVRATDSLRHEYFESYRKLRARMNKATTTEFIRSLRRNNNLAIKN